MAKIKPGNLKIQLAIPYSNHCFTKKVGGFEKSINFSLDSFKNSWIKINPKIKRYGMLDNLLSKNCIEFECNYYLNTIFYIYFYLNIFLVSNFLISFITGDKTFSISFLNESIF